VKKLTTKWEQIKKLAKSDDVKPWDFLKPSTEYADSEEADRRYDICLSCPLLNQTTKTCKECGCFMAAKTKLKQATCPVGKW
jgi:hypothetical protein